MTTTHQTVSPPLRERQQAIIAVLDQRGAVAACQRCGHPQHELCGEGILPSYTLPLQTNTEYAMPVVLLACKQCGHIVMHAKGVLGLS